MVAKHIFESEGAILLPTLEDDLPAVDNDLSTWDLSGLPTRDMSSLGVLCAFSHRVAKSFYIRSNQILPKSGTHQSSLITQPIILIK